jgi:hypothetical protein
MSEEFRPDDSPAATPLTREADVPRRDRWLMPLIAAGCTLAGVAVGFVLGQRSVPPERLAPAMAGESRMQDFDVDADDLHKQFFAFNFHRHDHRDFMPHVPPLPPMPPMGPRQLVVDNCNDDSDCTTVIKTKPDGSVVIVKTPKDW